MPGIGVPVIGSGLTAQVNALATLNGERRSVLIYATTDDEARGRIDVHLPGVPAAARLTRVCDGENDILAEWRSIGAPAYLTRDQQQHLQARNGLLSTSVTVVDGVAQLTLDTPGIALIEW